MSKLNTYHNAMLAHLKNGLGPLVRDAQLFAGRFEESDVAKFSLAAPAIRLGLLGMSSISQNSGGTLMQARAQWGAFIITKDAPGVARFASAFDLGERVLALVTRAVLLDENNCALAMAAREPRWQNLADMTGKDVMLSAVTWSTDFTLGAPGTEPVFGNLTSLHRRANGEAANVTG